MNILRPNLDLKRYQCASIHEAIARELIQVPYRHWIYLYKP
jgi:hypothetical protein